MICIRTRLVLGLSLSQLLVAGLVVPLSVLFWSPTEAADSSAVWQNFRTIYPYHVQTLALSEPNEQGERVIIIAEPPPNIGPAEIGNALATAFGNEVRRIEPHRMVMGYDGWVEDFVVSLTPEPDGAAGDRFIHDGIASLSRSLFGTSYKAYALRLPVAARDGVQAAPSSLSITAAELKRWLLDEERTFTRPEGGEPASLSRLVEAGEVGAFLGTESGLVLLSLRRDQDLATLRGEVRKFALDSDLIIGAVVLGDRDLTIVGREREC